MTQSLTLRSRVGADGLLHLNIPTPLTETDLEITILIRPVVEDNRPPEKFSEWWSKRLAKFPDAATKAAEHLTETDLEVIVLLKPIPPATVSPPQTFSERWRGKFKGLYQVQKQAAQDLRFQYLKEHYDL